MKSSLFAVLASAAIASAHYTFPILIVDGKNTGYYEHVRMTKNHYSHASIQDVSSPDLRCGGEDPQGMNATTADVQAGSTVGFVAEGDFQHPGPLQFYMAKIPAGQDPTKYVATGPVWFKIKENKPVFGGSTGLSFTEAGHKEKTVSVKIPAATPNGNYLLRVEHTALHGAGSAGGAQIYIQCAQVNVKAGGSGTPSPLVAFPGAYKATDPGLMIQIYNPVPTTYTFPGPKVWTG